MLVLSTPSGALASRKCAVVSSQSPLKFITKPKSNLCSPSSSDPWPRFIPGTKPPRRRVILFLAKADGGVDSKPSTSSSSSTPQTPFSGNDAVFVDQEEVPLEGVIQFEKPSSSSRIDKWGRVALLAGGDVLALLLFSAIGRFSHGFAVFSVETLRTADPFIAGWFLSAYFLGGYAEDGRGMNGVSKAVIAAAKSWLLGVPLGLIIRSASSGHIPPYSFILVTMGSTAVMLIGWRALIFNLLPNESKKDDMYRRGSPFELFELLTSLVRRW